jgi:hypothetical protein
VKAPNRLSVGELLLEGDLTARRLLLDPDALDAAAMVRTWPEVVQAGHEFLAILPRRGGGPGVHALTGVRSQDQTGERLQLMATSMHRHFAKRSWPGEGPADDQLLAIAGNLIRAHDMVASHRRPAPLLTPAVLADAAVARERVLHTLYVASHAINVAVQAQLRATPQKGKSTPRIVSSLRGAQQRLATIEAVAGREVYRTFPTDPALEHREPPGEDRLSAALAGWDIATHRALAREPSMANLAELTRVQTHTLAMTRTLLDAAASLGVLDGPAYHARLQPHLTAAESAWGTLHSTVRDLTSHTHRTVSPDLRAAGSEIAHALTEIVMTGTTLADPATIATRVHLPATTATLLSALDAPHQTSLLLHDAALHPTTTVSARAAQQLLTPLEAGRKPPGTERPDAAWVDPRALATDRPVPPPPPVRELLNAQLRDVSTTSLSMSSAATALTAPAQARPPVERRVRPPGARHTRPRGPSAAASAPAGARR